MTTPPTSNPDDVSRGTDEQRAREWLHRAGVAESAPVYPRLVDSLTALLTLVRLTEATRVRADERAAVVAEVRATTEPTPAQWECLRKMLVDEAEHVGEIGHTSAVRALARRGLVLPFTRPIRATTTVVLSAVGRRVAKAHFAEEHARKP